MTDPTPQATPTRDEAAPTDERRIDLPSGYYLFQIRPSDMTCSLHMPDGLHIGNLLTQYAGADFAAAMLASAPAPASGGVDAVKLDKAAMDWAVDCAHTAGVSASRDDVIGIVYSYLSALSPAATPVQTANCCHCGRIIDTRETTQGGDEFGAELSDGRWTCSPECWDAVVEPAATSVSVAGHRLDAAKAFMGVKPEAATPVSEAEPGEGMAEMGEIARIVSEWRNGPMLSPEALRQIAALARPASSPAGGDVEDIALQLRGANEVIAAIERAIPDWRSYRDLVDAIECKLAGRLS